MKLINKDKKALSIIEVMVAIFIFTLGISAIYMVIISTVNVNTYNKNFIIASNLAREQIELVRNVRDTNYEKFQKWNITNPNTSNYNTASVFTGSTAYLYKISNRYSGSGFPVEFDTEHYIAESNFKDAIINNSSGVDKYRLCLDSENRYVYCSGTLKKTAFYRYIEMNGVDKEVLGSGDVVENALKVRSKVFWNQKGVHNTEIDTILTDWKRL